MDEQTEVVALEATGLTQIERAQAETAMEIARRFPRGTAWINKAIALCCYSPEIAEQQFYCLKRKNADGTVKLIEGPSIRIAEAIAATYGNLRYASRVLDINEKFVVAQGVATDMETNTSVAVEVSRRITTSKGIRYGDDMIAVTANAACSIALRNALLRIIPRSYVQAIMERAKQTAVGQGAPIEATRQRAADAAGKLGVDPPRLCAAIGKTSLDELTREDLITIKGLMTAVHDGEQTVEQAFPHLEPPKEPEKPKTTGEKVREAAKRRAQKPAAPPEPEQPTNPPTSVPDDLTGQLEAIWESISQTPEKIQEQFQQRVIELGDDAPAVLKAWDEYQKTAG